MIGTLAAVGISRELGSNELLPLVMGAVLIGGLIQILMGVLRLGRYITLVPYSVVSGFMSGIGVIILCLQIGPLLGIKSQGGVITSLGTVFSQFTPNTAALLVGALTLAVVFLTPKRLSTWVPSPLIALVVITPLSMLLFQDGIPRIGTIPEGGLNFSLPNLKNHFPVLLRAGLVLAVLGAIDSLLTSLVADNISQSRHHSNRELIGQGIANSVAGLFNGLPGAGATMRTVINIKSGGRTPISGMAHSVFLLVLLLGAGPLAESIPEALLAGILIKVGLDIIDWGFLLRAHRLSIKTALVMWGVLLMTVFWDLIGAVLVGMFIANLLTIESITTHQLESMNSEDSSQLDQEEQHLFDRCGDALMLFRLQGPLSFGAAKGISERMTQIRQYKILLLDVTDVPHLGITATLAIERMVEEAEHHERQVLIAGANAKVKARLEQFRIHQLTGSRREALAHAAQELDPN